MAIIHAPMIHARALSKQVTTGKETLTLLNDINLSIDAGDSVAIVGISGSGKSTLLGLLAGLDTPTHGQIWLHGQEITALSEDGRAAVRARLVGFVFQTFLLFPNLTALENVLLPLELAGINEPQKRAKKLIERVGLIGRMHHYPRELSGGEQQRIAIARAFVTHPAILFADELTGNLDKKNGILIADLLFQLNREKGTTLVLVTHDEHLAARCQRQLILDNGRLIS